MTVLGFITALVALNGMAVRSQALPQPAAQAIRGRVVAAPSGQPLPNARVVVRGTPVAVRADLDGRFTITAPAAATLVITKPGFVQLEQPASARVGVPQPLDVRLTPASAVSGRVINEYGDPVVGASAFLVSMENPGRPIAGIAATTTDDRGEYRLGGVAPGTYVMGVRTEGAGATTAIPTGGTVGGRQLQALILPSFITYFPGTTDVNDATPLALVSGDDPQNIDFHLTATQTARQAMSVYPSTVSLRDTSIRTTGTAAIGGTVISSSGRVLPHAVVVVLDDKDSTFLTGSSGDDGRYEFQGLPAGSYHVLASKPGFFLPQPTGGLIALGSNGIAVKIAGDESRDRVDVTLLPWGAVSGRVFDESGEPVARALVGLLISRYEAGRRRLVVARTSQRYTDDRGEFRIFGIPDGDYVLGASVIESSDSSIGGYARTFFPGTSSASEARFITVAAGDDTKGLDFNLIPTATARVTGTLTDARGRPLIESGRATFGGHFNLLSRSALGARMDAQFTDGTFEFRNVPPGQYVIQADKGRLSASTEGEFAAYPVTIGRADVTGVVVQTSAGTTVTGRVTYESFAGAVPPERSVVFTAIPLDFDLAPSALGVAELNADGTFQLNGITGVRRLQATTLPPNWRVKSIVSDGIDVTDQALDFGRPGQTARTLDVVLTDRVNAVSGKVTDDRARSVTAARVVIFSADRERWYHASRFVRSTESAADGTFSITGIPPGSYFIASVARTPAGDEAWRDPAFLDSIRTGARSITVGEDDTQSVNLRVSSR